MRKNKIMNKFISKSDNTPLDIHSKYAAVAALKILKDNTSEYHYNKNKLIIKLASYLHDIGKCTEKFQAYLINGTVNDFDFYHNQTGAAFLAKHLILNKSDKRKVLNLVYWHHGVLNTSTYDEIYSTLSQADIKNMFEYVKNILGESYLSLEPIYDEDFTTPSNYFKSGENASENIDIILLRSVVIGGDRLVSKFKHEELNNKDIDLEINKSLSKSHTINLGSTVYDGSDRYEEQKKIVSLCENTTIINAPAGFGKTLIGILWGIRNNKKIIWVCPRNMVAESVYESVNNELKSLNLLDVSVELFLTGDIKKHNRNFDLTESFTSDIIITNIDSFLFTTINNSKLNYLYLTNDVNVIFDEYHELVTNSGIMSLFIYLMKIRHNILNSKTLLLSATYLPINFLWDGERKTKILPEEYKHFNAAHNKNYVLNIVNKPVINYNSLTILNSISLSQEYKIKTKAKYLIHSKFEQKERDSQFNKLISLYGKNSERNKPKNWVIGTHIIQASLDISFSSLNESILSPESTMQRIGRCDRWGDYENICSINIFKSKEKSEIETIKHLYDEVLNNLWFDYISQFNGQVLNLNDLYHLYDNFSVENKIKIISFISKMYENSKKNMSNIYPVKYLKNKNINYYTTSANKLRCSDNDMFVIYQKNDGTFTELFTHTLYNRNNISKEFNEPSNILLYMKKIMLKMNDNRYDYSYLTNKKNKSQKDKITLDDIREKAKKSNTPYIRFDCVYIPELGVVKVK